MNISIPSVFPNTLGEPFTKTSEKDPDYNCIAYAYGENTLRFWPNKWPQFVWPPDVPNTEDVDSFIKLFESIGYTLCNNGDLEPGYEKVAVYTLNGSPTHAAKQLQNGLWSSKLGPQEDVSHSLFNIGGGAYGDVHSFMRRPL